MHPTPLLLILRCLSVPAAAAAAHAGRQLWQVCALEQQGAGDPQGPCCCRQLVLQAQQQQGPAEAAHQPGGGRVEQFSTAVQRLLTQQRGPLTWVQLVLTSSAAAAC